MGLRGVGVTVMKILEWNLGDWKDGSMVKSIGCSCRGLSNVASIHKVPYNCL